VLGYTILVDPLPHRFASHVQWIKTQDLLFAKFYFKRLIKLGPSQTLTGMAAATLEVNYEGSNNTTIPTCTILCHIKSTEEIFSQLEDEVAEVPAECAEETIVAASVASAPVAVTSVAVLVAPVGAAASIENLLIKAVDVLAAIIIQLLNKNANGVSLSKWVKDMFNGKPIMENEVLGDL
jgi:hypothetical protein